MNSNQDEIFSASEGNRWFERNKSNLEKFDSETDWPMKLIELYHLRPQKVLEVGASNGVRLAAIAERYQSLTVAVEPSADAVQDGQTRFPHVVFKQGVAHDIPVPGEFDLVIVNFVLHWIDRRNLLRSIAEIDRLLVEGGFLIIGDFFPANATRVSYHHLPGQEIYTYKQNYATVFLASGLYKMIGLLTGEHASHTLRANVSDHDCVCVWLLRKTTQELYVENR
jgi:ubiquinone/menaquinone biosynthesis C-methylase UbiE